MIEDAGKNAIWVDVLIDGALGTIYVTAHSADMAQRRVPPVLVPANSARFRDGWSGTTRPASAAAATS